MALADLDPAERHRQITATFTERVRAAKTWDAQSPVAEWKAVDVVRHLVEWLPGFIEGGAGVRLPAGPSVDDDPLGSWTVQRDAVQALLEDPSTAEKTFTNPHIGDIPLVRAIDQFYTSDVFMHTWDLARATGQDDRLEAEFCEQMLGGMEQMEDVLRASGQFGPRVPVGDDASVQDRFIAFIGRDPGWTAR